MSEPSTFKFLSEEYLTAGDLSLSKLNSYTRINGHLSVAGDATFNHDLSATSLVSIAATGSLIVHGDVTFNKKIYHLGTGGVTLDPDTKAAWNAALGIPATLAADLAGKANKAGDTFTGLVTANAGLSVTGTFIHSNVTGVTLASPALWRAAVDANRAPIFPNNQATVALDSGNTMSIGVVEAGFVGPVALQLANLSTLKTGDCWEVCQVAGGLLTVSGTTATGQALTLQFPPGGGPKSAGLYSTMFIRVRSGSGIILVTGGVP
jgi:hypothetical protein